MAETFLPKPKQGGGSSSVAVPYDRGFTARVNGSGGRISGERRFLCHPSWKRGENTIEIPPSSWYEASGPLAPLSGVAVAAAFGRPAGWLYQPGPSGQPVAWRSGVAALQCLTLFPMAVYLLA